jgi:CRP/FNR family transcriptional regulator
MASTKADLLAAIPLFTGIGKAEMLALSQLAAEKRYSAGDVMFHEGDQCAGMFIVAQGHVKIYKTSPAGREMTIAVESAPSTVAELPMFDGGAYPASVSAIDDVVALFIDKREFFQLCRQYPEVSLKILAVVGRRLRHLVMTLESVTFGSIRQRLARLLIELADEAGRETFPMTMTHQELASRLGTVREVVSRNLSRFQVEGLIRVAERQINISNRGGLEREAETEL